MLADDYLAQLNAGNIKHRRLVVMANGVTKQLLRKTIPIRLTRTQDSWLASEERRIAQEDLSKHSPRQVAVAKKNGREMRRRTRAKQVLIYTLNLVNAKPAL